MSAPPNLPPKARKRIAPLLVAPPPVAAPKAPVVPPPPLEAKRASTSLIEKTLKNMEKQVGSSEPTDPELERKLRENDRIARERSQGIKHFDEDKVPKGSLKKLETEASRKEDEKTKKYEKKAKKAKKADRDFIDDEGAEVIDEDYTWAGNKKGKKPSKKKEKPVKEHKHKEKLDFLDSELDKVKSKPPSLPPKAASKPTPKKGITPMPKELVNVPDISDKKNTVRMPNPQTLVFPPPKRTPSKGVQEYVPPPGHEKYRNSLPDVEVDRRKKQIATDNAKFIEGQKKHFDKEQEEFRSSLPKKPLPKKSKEKHDDLADRSEIDDSYGEDYVTPERKKPKLKPIPSHLLKRKDAPPPKPSNIPTPSSSLPILKPPPPKSNMSMKMNNDKYVDPKPVNNREFITKPPPQATPPRQKPRRLIQDEPDEDEEKPPPPPKKKPISVPRIDTPKVREWSQVPYGQPPPPNTPPKAAPAAVKAMPAAAKAPQRRQEPIGYHPPREPLNQNTRRVLGAYSPFTAIRQAARRRYQTRMPRIERFMRHGGMGGGGGVGPMPRFPTKNGKMSAPTKKTTKPSCPKREMLTGKTGAKYYWAISAKTGKKYKVYCKDKK